MPLAISGTLFFMYLFSTESGILCQGTLFVIHDRLLSPSMATNTLATGTPTLRKDSGE
ncbi:MAG: hypothetical protein R6V21_07890 [Pelovirga sp.]